MMLRYMLDTNICIYAIKNRPAEVREKFNQQADRLCISTVTLTELLYGAEKSATPAHNLGVVESFVARLKILLFDERAASHTAQMRALLEKTGQPIGSYDTMIAGHARSLGLTVVTNNLREFACVPGLLMENWVG